MALIARCLFAAACLVGLTGAAAAQDYDPYAASEPLVEMSSAPVWGAGGYSGGHRWRGARHHHHAYRIAAPHTRFRSYAAPALPPVLPVAQTLPTRAIYAEPAPRTVYYNEPTVIIDGLCTPRAATRVMYDRCGYGCVRSAF